MKNIKSLFALVLSLIMIFSSLPVAFAADNSEFVNSDSENYVDGLLYAVNSDNNRVYRGKSESGDMDFFTSYAVNDLAVFDGKIYVSTGRYIRTVDISTREDVAFYKADAIIERFAVTDKGVYILANGKISFVNKNGNASVIVDSDEIQNFWLEDINSLAYILDENYIYIKNLEDGTVAREMNNLSSFGEEIPVKTKPSGKLVSSTASITDLRSKFPAGKYWNHVGSSSNNPDGYTSNPCTHHGNCEYNGSCGCNSFSSAIQCMGYAFKCGYDVYGSDPRKWENIYTNSSAIDSVKAGDVIRYRSDHHSIFVIGVSGDTIIYTDCNWNSTCVIRWNCTVSKSTVKSTFTKLYSAPYAAAGNTNSATIYTVKFNAGAGKSEYDSFKIYAGNEYGELPNATREGYQLAGWYTAPSGGTLITSSTICNSNITLYAHWNANTYTVSFDSNGGSSRVPSSFTIKHNGSQNIGSEKPTRTGYKFLYWNTKADGTGKTYKSGAVYSENTGAVLYAIWEGETYTVWFKPMGGTVSVKSMEVTYGSPYGDLPVPTCEGFDFGGWYTDSSLKNIASGSIVSIAHDHDLYAKWTEKIYYIIFNSNGGLGEDSQSKKYGETVILSASTPTRAGFNFTGWYTSSNGTGVKYSNGDSYSDNADIVLYAGWERQKYTITFDANGGTNAPEGETKEYEIDLTLPATVPTKTGYTCTGWNTSKDGTGKSFSVGGSFNLNATTTLYAQWAERSYNITYDANGGTGAPASQSKKHFSQESITLSTVRPTRVGYTFASWNTKKNATGTSYTPGATYNTNADVTLYAVWSANTYTVSFDSNCDVSSPSDISVRYDSTYASLPSISRTGYTFNGWYTSAIGGTMINYNDTVKITKDITLYAHWSANTYTVSFDSNGADAEIDDGKYIYDSVYGTLPTISREGYTFDGWYTAKTGGTKINSSDVMKIPYDTTFYAVWSPIVYTVTLDYGTGKTETKKVTFDSEYGTLPEPTREGYIFTGWYTQKNGDMRVTSSTILKTANNHTLYASWVAEIATAILDFKGGTCSVSFAQITYGEAFGALPTPVKEGYNFDGWYTENGTQITEKTVSTYTDAFTLYAKWSKAEYSITFNAGEGTCDTANKKVNYAEIVGTLPTPVKENSEFLGWYDSEGTEITETSIYTYSKNVSLNAKYAEKQSGYAKFVAGGEVVATVSFSDLPNSKPAVPEKKGYNGAWEAYTESADGVTVKAVYTPKEYTITWVIGETSTKDTYNYLSPVTVPTVSNNGDNIFTGWSVEIPTFMTANDITVTAEYSPIEYTAKFISDGKLYNTVTYTMRDTSVDEPVVPQKAGYIYKWDSYTLKDGGTDIYSSRTLIDYTAAFIAEGKTVDEITYNVETKSIKNPAIPNKNGYTGSWPAYTLDVGGIAVNAIYTPNIYTVTFTADNKVVDRVSYEYGAKSITEPEVPQKAGYTGKWGEYVLSYQNTVATAIYTPITYTATFIADGIIIGTVPFTIETTNLKEPAVPSKQGAKGSWAKYTIIPGDLTIEAVYTYNTNVSIIGYSAQRNQGYRTTITFRPKVSNTPNEYEIHWFINGVDMGTGNSDGTYTVKEAKSTYTVQIKVYSNGIETGHSEIETVNISNGFFERIIAFFKSLFNSLTTFTQ